MNPNQEFSQPQSDNSSEVVEDKPELFPIVGIGASAGGLEAFTQLLEHLPCNTGMGFVLVQHLDPHHKSLLADILSRKTQMPVLEVTDGMVVKPDHVYIIPPNKKMLLAQGVLRLTPREKTQGKYMSVDSLFYSLASERGDKAIGVVLSGEDGDGALGLEAIKEAGGITFAQSEKSARSHSMPHNAAAIGGVDFILPPSEIALELAKLRFFADATYGTAAQVKSDSDNLNQIFALLRTETGIDFTNYKHPTLKRRIQRRLVINKLTLEDYIIYLQKNPTEVQALSQDLLIHVTSFFRDPEVFEALKNQVFPRITQHKSLEEPIRIWVPGCSTGEEVYSIAMCLLEFLDGQTLPKIQIFATDISESAIDKARNGQYNHNLLETVSPLRLQRFFTQIEGGYQISKSVRQMCVFAKQNLSADPPFSKLDLISCRNVLIYLSPALQQKVIPLFHYSLKPTGFLLLGTSESTGDFSDLFAVVNKKQKIYERKLAPSRLNFNFFNSNYSLNTVSEKKIINNAGSDLDLQTLADQIVWNKYAPPGVVINSDMEILQFRGETSPYLRLAPGKPNFNLLKMAQPSLRLELRTAIKQAKQQNASVTKSGIQVTSQEQSQNISFEVIPILAPFLEKYFLVLFESVPVSATPIVERTSAPVRRQTGIEQELNQLKQELATNKQELAGTRDYLQSIIQEQEIANQDMMTANEEIMSSNEEYQSTNEELETAKEEIQSTNEELNTTNEELSERIIESNRLNDDLSNLLGSVNIPIIMLSNDLCIRRFTPMAEKIFNLIPTDIGRPLNHINHNLHIPQLEQLITDVIDTQLMKAQEVQDKDGHWYDLRICPYKTTENHIDGAVLVLVNIDFQKHSNMRIQASRDEAEAARLTAEAANLAKDEFLSVVSHELRNPLTSILGWSQLLRRRQFNTDQTAKALETIEHNAQSQVHLIEDLLDISRITTGKLQLNVNLIALAPAIEEAINVTQISANAKNIQIEFCVPTETIQVLGDADRLQQILWNLLSNAIKFTPVGGRVTVKLEQRSEFAQIQVSDTGQGISAEFLPYIFERFRQADSRSTRKHGGLGLGLSIVYYLVELHGGQISVESLGEGQGTTMTVKLPLSVPVLSLPSDSPLLSSIIPVIPSDITLTLSGLGVLVVDDDAALRQLLKIIIEQYGGIVTTAGSAKEAISALTEHPGAYNVLLSDIGMPNENGYALIQQVRALSAECGGQIPAAVLSGYVSAQQQRESENAGFQRHIAKPVTTDQLISVIAELAGLNAK